MMKSSRVNNPALEDLNNELLELMNNRGIIASYLMSPLSKIINAESTSQFKLVKDSNSNRVIDLKIHNSKPVTLHNKLLTFHDTGKQFELKGDLLKLITNKNDNVDHACLLDKKLMYDFAKEMHFDIRAPGNKSTRNRTLKKLPKSSGLMVSASCVSKTIFLTCGPNKLCDRLKLFLQEKQGGNNSNIIDE